MADVFISYARENLEHARNLAERLYADGLAVWWDNLIAHGTSWEATIERELEAAKVVVVLWSTASVASENVRSEARRAQQGQRLLQIFLDDCSPPLFFGERQGLGLANWDGSRTNQYIAVLEGAREIVAGRSEPKAVEGMPRRREQQDTIDENDPRYLALSPMDRLTLSLSPLDVARAQQFKRKLEIARERTRIAGVRGGPVNWFIANLCIASAKTQCRKDEIWHRRYVRSAYKNELVRELQLGYVVDVFDDRRDEIQRLKRELGPLI